MKGARTRCLGTGDGTTELSRPRLQASLPTGVGVELRQEVLHHPDFGAD